MHYQLITGMPDTPDYLVFTTTFQHNNVFYKAALAETITWDGKLTGTYDVLLQSGRGTQRLTMVRHEQYWRAGEEIEQIGSTEQPIIDLLGGLIDQLQSNKGATISLPTQ
jgi:hypothetical protein